MLFRSINLGESSQITDFTTLEIGSTSSALRSKVIRNNRSFIFGNKLNNDFDNCIRSEVVSAFYGNHSNSKCIKCEHLNDQNMNNDYESTSKDLAAMEEIIQVPHNITINSKKSPGSFFNQRRETSSDLDNLIVRLEDSKQNSENLSSKVPSTKKQIDSKNSDHIKSRRIKHSSDLNVQLEAKIRELTIMKKHNQSLEQKMILERVRQKLDMRGEITKLKTTNIKKLHEIQNVTFCIIIGIQI